MASESVLGALAFFFTFTVACDAAGVLVVPPGPGDLGSVERLAQSGDYKVEVRKAGDAAYIECFVYKTENYWKDTYFGNPSSPQKSVSFTNFSFNGTAVEVRVTAKGVVNTVTVRPLNFGIQAVRAGNAVTFTLAAPRKISVEINDRLNPLFLFADAPDAPDPQATYYYGPGVHKIGLQKGLKSGESVYIAGGAVVEGSFSIANNSDKVSIRGRGILTMGEWPHTSTGIDFLGGHSAISSNINTHFFLEGITIANSTGWTITTGGGAGGRSHDNQYRNVKLVSWNGNSDGIWFDGNNNLVDDCFIFTNDDIVTTHGSVNCRISNLTAWGGVWGRLFMHADHNSSSDLTFENINLLGKAGGVELIKVETANNRAVQLKNFTFRNIRIEEHTKANTYNTNVFLNMATAKHTVTNWNFENITLDDKNAGEGVLYGTAEGPINGVTFTNLKMGGALVTSLAQANMKSNGFATNIRFVVVDPTPIHRMAVPNSAAAWGVRQGNAFNALGRRITALPDPSRLRTPSFRLDAGLPARENIDIKPQ
jgi:hypothetical protein